MKLKFHICLSEIYHLLDTIQNNYDWRVFGQGDSEVPVSAIIRKALAVKLKELLMKWYNQERFRYNSQQLIAVQLAIEQAAIIYELADLSNEKDLLRLKGNIKENFLK